MKALVKTAKGDGLVELWERDRPSPAPGWVVVRVALGGICGTDLHILHDEFPYWPPVILGHEFTGTVEEVGEGVPADLVGRRIVCEPHSGACGTCYLCRRGIAELCGTKRSPGWGIDGAFAPWVTVPAHLLHPVPEGIPDVVAALAEPMAIGMTALHRVRVEAGDAVLVVGPGPVGVLTAIAARALGAASVLVSARHPSPRLDFAAGLGLDTADSAEAALAAIRERTDGRGADLVVEASGAEDAIALAIEAVRRRGRLAAIGFSARPTVAVPWDLAVMRAPDVVFSTSSSHVAWGGALEILRREAAALQAMGTVFPLAAWQDAFRAVEERTVTKAFLDPRPAEATA